MVRKMERRPHIYKSEGYWTVQEGFAGHWNDLAHRWVEEKNATIVVNIMSHFPDLFNGPGGEFIAHNE